MRIRGSSYVFQPGLGRVNWEQLERGCRGCPRMPADGPGLIPCRSVESVASAATLQDTDLPPNSTHAPSNGSCRHGTLSTHLSWPPAIPFGHHHRRAICFCRGQTSAIVLPSYMRPFFITYLIVFVFLMSSSGFLSST